MEYFLMTYLVGLQNTHNTKKIPSLLIIHISHSGVITNPRLALSYYTVILYCLEVFTNWDERMLDSTSL